MARVTRWLKRHSRDEIDRTRDHKVRERVVLNEFIMMMDEHDGPVPNRLAAITARIQCEDLPRQAVQASINVLLNTGDLALADDGKRILIPWMMDVLHERSERCAANKRVASDREAKRQLDATSTRPNVEHEPTSNGATSKTAIEINGDDSTNVPQTKNHHHQTQIQDGERDLDSSPQQAHESQPSEGAGRAFLDPGFQIDDDDQGGKLPLAKPLPATLIRALELRVGEERAAELEAEYLGSDYGRNRRHDGAFVKWLAKTYAIQVSTRGSTFGPQQIGDIGTVSLKDAAAALGRRRMSGLTPAAAH